MQTLGTGGKITRIKRECDVEFRRRGLCNQRGQASILIAIIFQVLFIFFAMVINVGLLVNDKINLQNSVDIAAYYGAMKQAEVLNAMAHINYEIHAAYKLFNYRLWILANAGRGDFIHSGLVDMEDHKAHWPDNIDQPIVCLANPLWYDQYLRKGRNPNPENTCYNALFHVTAPTPVSLIGPQNLPLFSSFLDVYVAQSQANFQLFQADFQDTGATDYAMALKMIASFKITVAKKRQAMQSLQQLLIGGAAAQNITNASDFSDIAGNSVKDTVQKIISKNLTAANKKGLSKIEFNNSLAGRPFLVPVQVRTFIKYEDFTNGASADGTPQDMNVEPKNATATDQQNFRIGQLFWSPDYLGGFPQPSAADFAQEQDPLHIFYSLVSFEKDPWTAAFVRVYAETSPKMLFSPFVSAETQSGTVTLKAEAYAMPFGGRLGPWYFDSWSPKSTASDQGNKIDPLLPPRYDEPPDLTVSPNYSRYPGDTIGMRSALFATQAQQLIYNGNPALRPHFKDDDYNNLDMSPDVPSNDPVVFDNAQGEAAAVRVAEIAASAPNLFDAVYYSISPHFATEYTQDVSGGQAMFDKFCAAHCDDLGTRKPAGSTPIPFDAVAQLDLSLKYLSQCWWFLQKPEHLLASWTQEGTDNYVAGPTKVGQAKTAGGRSGYSVKIVSKEFLNRNNLPFGGGDGKISGSLKNNPSQLGL